MKFVLGEYNEEAYVLSRWRRIEGSRQGDCSKSREGQSMAEERELIAVNVSDLLDDYSWNILHSGHIGLARMLHRRRD